MNALKLFDICSCKCLNLKNCSCARNRKIPALEHDFIIDQRTKRRLMISSTDKKRTKTLANRAERQTKSVAVRQPPPSTQNVAFNVPSSTMSARSRRSSLILPVASQPSDYITLMSTPLNQQQSELSSALPETSDESSKTKSQSVSDDSTCARLEKISAYNTQNIPLKTTCNSLGSLFI